jgi:hypothetical protein
LLSFLYAVFEQGYEVRQPRAWLPVDTIVVESTDHLKHHNVRFLSMEINQDTIATHDAATTTSVDNAAVDTSSYGTVLNDKRNAFGSQNLSDGSHRNSRLQRQHTAAKDSVLEPKHIFAT